MKKPSEKYEILRQETILSQYSASPRILALTEAFAGRIDPADDIETFYTEIFDIDTARGWGLDNWGRILAAPRIVRMATTDWFGFHESTLKPFNNAPFWTVDQSTAAFSIGDDMYRRLLMFKAGVNIGDSTADSVSRLLSYLFEIPIGAVDNGDMSVSFRVSSVNFDETDRAIVRYYGGSLLPAGVRIHEFFRFFDPAENDLMEEITFTAEIFPSLWHRFLDPLKHEEKTRFTYFIDGFKEEIGAEESVPLTYETSGFKETQEAREKLFPRVEAGLREEVAPPLDGLFLAASAGAAVKEEIGHDEEYWNELRVMLGVL